MSDLVVELSQKAQTLRPEDRARLAELLLDSIHKASDLTVEAAWEDELQKRMDEVDRGVAKLISADEVFAQVRRAIH
jgi:putative addiction module component (TIGR02574 family)